ncbi:class I SAM-dependent methyltransferase [Kutzneria albida]|uniref:Methyltransferase type 12 n=1 Tax=Kutzneria albida DSM 43870 TaxID=1449976 RepID=W5W7G0_9PSEU|nr:class I SAM-dependent methyltransferase [Kutzneria albida]AHH96867.1 Methyltransferase type 12 [Kutzneria albida DSM 43870]
MTSTQSISPELAAHWLARWDTQQELYIADREERFTVIGDVVAHVVADRAAPQVLDLGCGPASLSTRLARRLPSARFVGVDNDPLLLALARATAPESVRFAETNLADPSWSNSLGLDGELDAAVSTTALHWLAEPDLSRLYRDVANLLRPGGVLVNGDHMAESQPDIARIQQVVKDGRAARRGVQDNEDWAAWWVAAEADEVLAPLVAQRRSRGVRDHGTGVGLRGHVELLRQAGFREVATVWQSGDDHVLVAVR